MFGRKRRGKGADDIDKYFIIVSVTLDFSCFPLHAFVARMELRFRMSGHQLTNSSYFRGKKGKNLAKFGRYMLAYLCNEMKIPC